MSEVLVTSLRTDRFTGIEVLRETPLVPAEIWHLDVVPPDESALYGAPAYLFIWGFFPPLTEVQEEQLRALMPRGLALPGETVEGRRLAYRPEVFWNPDDALLLLSYRAGLVPLLLAPNGAYGLREWVAAHRVSDRAVGHLLDWWPAGRGDGADYPDTLFNYVPDREWAVRAFVQAVIDKFIEYLPWEIAEFSHRRKGPPELPSFWDDDGRGIWFHISSWWRWWCQEEHAVPDLPAWTVARITRQLPAVGGHIQRWWSPESETGPWWFSRIDLDVARRTGLCVP